MASAPPGAEEQARKELHTALYNNPRIENLEEALKIAASVGIDMEPLVSEAKSTLLDLKEMRRFLAEALLLQFEGKLLEAGYTRILELSQMTTKDCRAVGFKGGHEKKSSQCYWTNPERCLGHPLLALLVLVTFQCTIFCSPNPSLLNSCC